VWCLNLNYELCKRIIIGENCLNLVKEAMQDVNLSSLQTPKVKVTLKDSFYKEELTQRRTEKISMANCPKREEVSERQESRTSTSNSSFSNRKCSNHIEFLSILEKDPIDNPELKQHDAKLKEKKESLKFLETKERQLVQIYREKQGLKLSDFSSLLNKLKEAKSFLQHEENEINYDRYKSSLKAANKKGLNAFKIFTQPSRKSESKSSALSKFSIPTTASKTKRRKRTPQTRLRDLEGTKIAPFPKMMEETLPTNKEHADTKKIRKIKGKKMCSVKKELLEDSSVRKMRFIEITSSPLDIFPSSALTTLNHTHQIESYITSLLPTRGSPISDGSGTESKPRLQPMFKPVEGGLSTPGLVPLYSSRGTQIFRVYKETQVLEFDEPTNKTMLHKLSVENNDDNDSTDSVIRGGVMSNLKNIVDDLIRRRMLNKERGIQTLRSVSLGRTGKR